MQKEYTRPSADLPYVKKGVHLKPKNKMQVAKETVQL